MIDVLILCVVGLLDRIRGGWPTGRPIWAAHVATSAAYALMTSLVTLDWRLLACALVLGELAWRHDAGWRGDWVRDEGEWWQPMRWGLLWAAPMVALAALGWGLDAPAWGLLVYLVAAPLGALAAAELAAWLSDRTRLKLWPVSELLELPFAGALALLLLSIR